MPAGIAQYQTTGTQLIDLEREFYVADDIVVAEEILEEVTKGGIIIPDVQDAQKMRWARVVVQGPGRRDEDGERIPMWTQPGDLVMFGKYQSGGEPISINGKTYLLFRIGDFVGRRKRADEIAPVRAVA